MKQIQTTETPCIRVEIKGYLRQGMRIVPFDGAEDLVSAFLKWQAEAEIFPLFTATSGPGFWSGYFAPGDMPRVRYWLEGQQQ